MTPSRIELDGCVLVQADDGWEAYVWADGGTNYRQWRQFDTPDEVLPRMLADAKDSDDPLAKALWKFIYMVHGARAYAPHVHIKGRRLKLGLTQRQLARASRVSRSTISRIERRAQSPLTDTYADILCALERAEGAQ